MAEEIKKEEQGKKGVIERAKKRYKIAEEAWSDINEQAREDVRFSVGDQWNEEEKVMRQKDRRPCLTINRLPSSIRQVTNDLRQNRPSIKVSPVDDRGDVKTAKIFQGIIRHIENKSGADAAFDNAGDGAVRKGFGYFRVITDYCNPYSFDQDILIKRIPNSFSVKIDPFFQEADASDIKWAHIDVDMPIDDFKAQYPNAEINRSGEDWGTVVRNSDGWVTENSVRVSEYFETEYEDEEIALLSDGRVLPVAKLPKAPEMLLGQNGEPLQVVRKRKTQIPKIKWYKIAANEIVDETDWLGKWIPIVSVFGDEINNDGERVLEGIVRHAKDSQKMYNYYKSSEAEAIGLAPKAPYIMAEGQDEGYEEMWATANTRTYSVLKYRQVELNGEPAPPPQRQGYEPAIMASTQAAAGAAEEIKVTTAVYDASLGARSNEQSGIAIQRRANQSQTTNFHYADNLARAIRHLGRILVDLIPKVFDAPRALLIIGEEDQQELVWVNKIFNHKGEDVEYNLGAGEYDVTVSQGPSYQTKRQEAVATMLELTKALPQQAALFADLMVKSMDLPGNEEIAERIKKTLPPGVAETSQEDQKPLPPEVQAEMQRLQQQNQQLVEQLNHKTQQVETKALELESKERIEMAKLQVELEIKLAELGSKEGEFLLKNEVAQIEKRLNILNQNNPIENEQGAGFSEPMAPQNFNQQTAGEPTPGGAEY